MNIIGFHHLAIQVQQLERTASFYREVLGLLEMARYHRDDGSVRSIWMSWGDGFLALEETDELPAEAPFRTHRPGLHLLSLRIAAHERSEVVAQIQAAGIAIEHQTKWTVYLRDPEGNRIGLSHHPDDGV